MDSRRLSPLILLAAIAAATATAAPSARAEADTTAPATDAATSMPAPATGVSTDAATAPATAPATEPVAADSPKAALKAYNLAMRDGDVTAMNALQYATTDDQRHIARCSSQSDLQVAALLSAARDKFGEDGAKQLAKVMDDEDDDAVDAATQTVKGDHAEIRFPGSSDAVPMIRIHSSTGSSVGWSWAVDIGAMLRDSQVPADPWCDQIIRRGSAAKVTAQEIKAGQFKSAAAAALTLKGRLKES